MPVVLEPADWALWLGEAEGDGAALMCLTDGDVIRMWRVSRRVNSVRNNGTDLLEPEAVPEVSPEGGPNPP